MGEKNNYDKLKRLALERGASLFGVAHFDPEQENAGFPGKILKGLETAVSLGVRLSGSILDGIADRPTKLYFHHYRSVNVFLDQLAIGLQQFIQKEGFRALPVPASLILDWERQTAHLSHKRLALAAGIGWLGRNNLIVSPQYGAQIRLATILTDMPLKRDEPLKEDCGNCNRCVSICPSKSIGRRQADFDHMGCYEKLKEFRKNRYVDQYICGICVKVCDGKRQ